MYNPTAYFALANQHLHDFIKYVSRMDSFIRITKHKLIKVNISFVFFTFTSMAFLYRLCQSSFTGKNQKIAESIMETKYNKDIFSCQISVGSFQFNNGSTLSQTQFMNRFTVRLNRKHSMDIMSCFMKYEKITIIYGVQ